MILNNDLITLIPYRPDKFGVSNETPIAGIEVHIEDNNKLIYKENSDTIKPKLLVMTDEDFTGRKGDFITIQEVNGEASTDTTKYKIIEVFSAGGFFTSHKEVYI